MAGDTYNIGSGLRLDVGRYHAPSDVVSNVWTPTKGPDGRILDDSWANLPLNEWCRVSNTTPQLLQNALIAAGFNPASKDYGTAKNVLPSFNAWVGMAFDPLTGKAYIPAGGGHADGSMNGVWSIDFERMGGSSTYGIEKMPSDPDDATYPWSAAYKALSTGTFTAYTPIVTTADSLPDGTPTSRHQYNGVWFDRKRRQVGMSRNAKWVYDLDTQQWTRTTWTKAGSGISPTIDHHLHCDHVKDRVVGFFRLTDNDSYNDWSQHDLNAGGALAYIGTPRPVSIASGMCVHERALWVFAQGSPETWSRFDLNTNGWTHGTIGNPVTYDYTQEMQVAVYIPEWGKVLRRFTWSTLTGTWRLFDVATKSNESYTPAGLAPPFATWPGNKYVYYPRRRCVLAFVPNALASDAIYVMRVG